MHKQSCSSLAFSSDARFLLTAGDRVLKVWDYGMRFDVNSQVLYSTTGQTFPLQLSVFRLDCTVNSIAEHSSDEMEPEQGHRETNGGEPSLCLGEYLSLNNDNTQEVQNSLKLIKER